MNWSAEIRFADVRSEAGIRCKLEHPECAFVFGCSVVRPICANHNPFSVIIVHTKRQISTEDA